MYNYVNMNTDVYSCTPESVPESSNESADNMGVIKSNMASMITGQSPDIRYVVVHNKTSDTVYPALQLKSKTSGDFIMDDDAPTGNIPSGFKLEPGEYKILTVPRYAISGKIVARTGCRYVSRYHHTDGTSSCGLYCQTGDCKQSPPKFPNSQSGVLCGELGAEPPTTSVEFSFDDNVDFYDISQVDGNNISASMQPLDDDHDAEPPGDPPKDASGTILPKNLELWCTRAACNPVSGEDGCPPELRVYDKMYPHGFVGCQSIYKSVAGIIAPVSSPSIHDETSSGDTPADTHNNEVHCNPQASPPAFCPGGEACAPPLECVGTDESRYCKCPPVSDTDNSPQSIANPPKNEVHCNPQASPPAFCPTGVACTSPPLECVETGNSRYCICPPSVSPPQPVSASPSVSPVSPVSPSPPVSEPDPNEHLVLGTHVGDKYYRFGLEIDGGPGFYAQQYAPFALKEKEIFSDVSNLANQYMIWDENATTPVHNDVVFDPNNKLAEQKDKYRIGDWSKGRWVLDTNNQCSEVTQDCIQTKTIFGCEAYSEGDVKNDCGDIDAKPSVPPQLTEPDQGCSPYVISSRLEEHRKHVCWKEDWPRLDSLTDWCQGKLSDTECDYANVYKKQCPLAYSWQFDDLNSTYTCSKDNNVQGGGTPLLNYYIVFEDKTNTWDEVKGNKIPAHSKPGTQPDTSPGTQPDTSPGTQPDTSPGTQPSDTKKTDDPDKKDTMSKFVDFFKNPIVIVCLSILIVVVVGLLIYSYTQREQ